MFVCHWPYPASAIRNKRLNSVLPWGHRTNFSERRMRPSQALRSTIPLAFVLCLTAHAESLTGTKATADAKAEVTLSTLLSATNFRAAAVSAHPPRRHPALYAMLRRLRAETNPAVVARAALLP